MKYTKFFELLDPKSASALYFLSVVSQRCAGADKDPDTNQDWSNYKKITISFIRSLKSMPVNEEEYNIIGDNVWNFTIEEITDSNAPNSPKVNAVADAIKKFNGGKFRSHFFLMVELE